MKTTLISHARHIVAAALLLGVSTPQTVTAGVPDQTYLGRWALTIPGGKAGWLGVEAQPDGTLKSSLLWGGGSVLPTSETRIENGNLIVVRKMSQKRDDKTIVRTQTITARRDGDKLLLTTRTVNELGREMEKGEFDGRKIPDLPPRPNPATLKWGAPMPLFNGKDLSGWQAMSETAPNCWSVTNGMLINRVRNPDGTKKHGANLRTVQEFEDFNLKTEVRVPENGNSGIYLRGIYEVQVAESFGKPVDPHNMGALYSRITPAVAAERPAGEWQTLDITLVDRHLTVILNGKTIIDNAPVLGCTGGAMSSDEFKPGPIFLQGDHTDVDYRNMVLTPIVKK